MEWDWDVDLIASFFFFRKFLHTLLSTFLSTKEAHEFFLTQPKLTEG